MRDAVSSITSAISPISTPSSQEQDQAQVQTQDNNSNNSIINSNEMNTISNMNNNNNDNDHLVIASVLNDLVDQVEASATQEDLQAVMDHLLSSIEEAMTVRSPTFARSALPTSQSSAAPLSSPLSSCGYPVQSPVHFFATFQ